ncbi:MAG: FeoB-associated Cys-rich membrane protein [Clostridia bacterium]|nr:FeoB-associated Cys-rich membrane protein [Clostridia bacterium]
MSFWKENMATILICLLVAAGVIAVVFKMLKDRKKGKSSCSCGCGGCAFAGSCTHQKKK